MCGYVREKGEMAECMVCKREVAVTRRSSERERDTQNFFTCIIYTRVNKNKWIYVYIYIFICIYSLFGAKIKI